MEHLASHTEKWILHNFSDMQIGMRVKDVKSKFKSFKEDNSFAETEEQFILELTRYCVKNQKGEANRTSFQDKNGVITKGYKLSQYYIEIFKSLINNEKEQIHSEESKTDIVENEIDCHDDFSSKVIMEKYERRLYFNYEQVVNDMLKIWRVVDKKPKYAIKKTYNADDKVWKIGMYKYSDFIFEIRGINVIERTTKNNVQTITAYDVYLKYQSVFHIKEFKEPFTSNKTVVKTDHQGCYLIQLYCDKGTNKYKIGKSKNILTRLKSTEYRNAFIYLTQFVTDENKCEKELIEEFTKKFTRIKEDSEGSFGNEIFSGSINDMMDEFYRICSHYRT